MLYQSDKDRIRNTLIIVLIIAITIIIGYVAISTYLKKSVINSTEQAKTPLQQADQSYKDADNALKEGNVAKAKELFLKAEAGYQASGNIEKSMDADSRAKELSDIEKTSEEAKQVEKQQKEQTYKLSNPNQQSGD